MHPCRSVKSVVKSFRSFCRSTHPLGSTLCRLASARSVEMSGSLPPKKIPPQAAHVIAFSLLLTRFTDEPVKAAMTREHFLAIHSHFDDARPCRPAHSGPRGVV